MKKTVLKIVSVFFVLMFSLSSLVTAYAVATPSDPENTTHALVIESDSLTVAIGRKIQMTARVTNVNSQPQIIWSTSDSSVARVDETGSVRGVSVGSATITASAVVGGETLRGDFVINVTKNANLIRNLLEDRQILSYQYSYIDDYYYTNDKEAWQYDFGFGRIYDLAAPYILLEYDYVRIFFTYENKDWMLQMWKGQYGLIFYGGEIGIYNREHSPEGVDEWAMYNCPAEEDWLMMEMTLYHQDLNGNYVREFTREYDKYWWCTGFVPGKLENFSDRSELSLKCRITMKDQAMLDAFTKSIQQNGLVLDKDYTVSGLDVFMNW